MSTPGLFVSQHLVDPGLKPETPWTLGLVSSGTTPFRVEFYDEHSRPVQIEDENLTELVYQNLSIGVTPYTLCQLMWDNGFARSSAIPGWPDGATSCAIRNDGAYAIAFNFGGSVAGAVADTDGFESVAKTVDVLAIYTIEPDGIGLFGRFPR